MRKKNESKKFKIYNGLCGTGIVRLFLKKKVHMDMTVCEKEGRRPALLDSAWDI
jgi:hypothetical protein